MTLVAFFRVVVGSAAAGPGRVWEVQARHVPCRPGGGVLLTCSRRPVALMALASRVDPGAGPETRRSLPVRSATTWTLRFASSFSRVPLAGVCRRVAGGRHRSGPPTGGSRDRHDFRTPGPGASWTRGRSGMLGRPGSAGRLWRPIRAGPRRPDQCACGRPGVADDPRGEPDVRCGNRRPREASTPVPAPTRPLPGHRPGSGPHPHPGRAEQASFMSRAHPGDSWGPRGHGSVPCRPCLASRTGPTAGWPHRMA